MSSAISLDWQITLSKSFLLYMLREWNPARDLLSECFFKTLLTLTSLAINFVFMKNIDVSAIIVLRWPIALTTTSCLYFFKKIKSLGIAFKTLFLFKKTRFIPWTFVKMVKKRQS